jgi:hypothetical protein
MAETLEQYRARMKRELAAAGIEDLKTEVRHVPGGHRAEFRRKLEPG